MQLCGKQQAWGRLAGGRETARQMSGSKLSQGFRNQEMKTRESVVECGQEEDGGQEAKTSDKVREV